MRYECSGYVGDLGRLMTCGDGLSSVGETSPFHLLTNPGMVGLISHASTTLQVVHCLFQPGAAVTVEAGTSSSLNHGVAGGWPTSVASI